MKGLTVRGRVRDGLVAAAERPDALVVVLGVLLYALWATNVTWPLLEAPGDSVLGGLGDQTGGIAYLRETIQDGEFPFAPGALGDFAAPEGRKVDWEVNLSSWPWLLPAWLIGLVAGPIAGFAIVDWLGFVLSGVTMQLLATRLTRSAAAGLVAGFAFAFFPYAVIKAAAHPVFAHGWPLALLAWRQLELYDAPTRRNIVLAALAAVLAVGFTSYYVLIGGVLLATCTVIALLAAWRHGGAAALRAQARAQAIVNGAAVLYLAVLTALTLGGGSASLRAHDPSTVVNYAARLHEFFVPFGRNLVFGDRTAPWLQERQHGSNFSETTLYLGLVVLALAVVGLGLVLLRRTPSRLRWGCVAALAVTLIGVAWSAPPEVVVGPLTVPTPSRFVTELTTTWRVYARFVIVVMLGVSLMAAVGIAALTRGRGPFVTALVATVALGAVAGDFWWRPGVLRIEEPPAYDLLRERPRGIVAQYPLLPAGFGDSSDIFWQDAHGHPVLNGYGEDGHQDRRAATLYFLDRPATARALASLGVRYVFVPDDDVFYVGTPHPGAPGRGFKLVGRRAYGPGTASVYAVTARPDPGYAYVRVGADREEGSATDPFVWLTEQDAVIDVDAPMCSRPCRGRLRMRLASLVRGREVTLRLPGHGVVWRGTAGSQPRDISLPLEVRGSVEVTVRTDPPPTPIVDALPGSTDARSVSLQIWRLRFAR